MKKLVVLEIFVSFLLLVGCGNNKPKEKLIIWQTESDPNARQILDSIKEDFESKHNVEIEIILNSWGAQADKLTKAIKTDGLPDIAHIQPFMEMSFISIDKLVPLNDVYSKLEQTEGKMFDIAKEVTRHNGINYGIPYALGITSWSYNSTKCISNFENALSWDEFLANCILSKEKDKNFSIMVPGASPFFMEQLYGELLANNNGKLFDENGNPLFESIENIEVLNFLRKLKDNDLLHPNWKNQTYLDQFTQLAEGNTSCVLVTYARASNTIKEIVTNKALANDSIYSWMKQPAGPSGHINNSISTLDCEPWVIFKKDNSSDERIKLCKAFLLAYYEKSNYKKFVSQVPMHLTPIFIDLSKDQYYLDKIKGWESWNTLTMDYLLNKDSLSTRPILMPDNTEIGRSWGFLLELQYSQILSNAIIRTLNTDDNIEEIANDMQLKATDFLTRANFNEN